MKQSLSKNGRRKLIATIAFAGLMAFCTFAMAYKAEEFAKDAKIGLQTARDIALKASPGRHVS